MIEASVQQKINTWLNGNYDQETKEAIHNLTEEELIDAFYKDLEFGTGGLRGIMGVGSNRVNKYTIGAATQGLCNYLKKSFPDEQIKVAIAHDSRNNSSFFAQVAADIFSANGFIVYAFMGMRPTPELSFTIRHLGCHSGVVITASHNPKEYNGYKVYWNDGAQVVEPHDKNIIKEVYAIQSIDDINFNCEQENIKLIGRDIDEIYLNKICRMVFSKRSISRQKDLKIVYSPLHGSGVMLVPYVLQMMGFENVNVVESQAEPNGNFPTVTYPNPEEKEAMSLAIRAAEMIDADVIMATDPDADRVGVGVKNHKGEYILLNGNQTASIITAYMLKNWQQAGKINGKQMIIKTIVTSEILNKIADKNGVNCYDTLTGFKYIAALIRSLEGKEEFIVGGEESYGYMIGDFVRDKDAVASCAMVAEITAYAKERGLTLFDMLIDIYREYGFYLEDLISLTKKGKKGAEEIEEMMQTYRQNPPQEINGSKVIRLLDYKNLVEKNLLTGEEKTIQQPKSNVLQFYTEDGSKISARPSGTEPKIKFYFSVNTSLTSKEDYESVKTLLQNRIQGIIESMGLGEE